MGWFWEQLGLLLRTKLILRTRQPVILALEILWPLTIFLIVLGVRKAVPPVPQDVCYYNSRALPSGGAIPMLQSLVCNIENDCLDRNSYEEIPSYPQARVGQIVDQLTPVLSDNKTVAVIKALPKGVRLLETVAETVGDPVIRDLLDNGITVKNFLKDPDKIVNILQEALGLSSTNVPKAIVNSKITLFKLLELVGKSDKRKSLLCDPAAVGELLSIVDSQLQNETSEALCHLQTANLSRLMQKVMEHLNLDALLQMMSDVLVPLGRPDISTMLQDIGKMIKTLSDLPSLSGSNEESTFTSHFLPHLQAIAEAFQSGNVDINVLIMMVRDMEPVFGDGPLPAAIRQLLGHLDSVNVTEPVDKEQEINLKIEPTNGKFFTLGFVIPPALSTNLKQGEKFRQSFLKQLLSIPVKPEAYRILRDVSSAESFQSRVCKSYDGLRNLVEVSDDDSQRHRDLQSLQDELCSVKIQASPISQKQIEVEPILQLLTNTSALSSVFKNFEGNDDSNPLSKIIPISRVIIEATLNSFNEERSNNKQTVHIAKVILNTLGRVFPLPYSNFTYALLDGLDVVFDLFSRAVNGLLEDKSEKNWPHIAKTLVATLSTQKANVPKRCTSFSDLFCDASLYRSVVVVPEGANNSPVLQEIGCHIFSSVNWTGHFDPRSTLLSKPPITAFGNETKNATINWGGVAKKAFAFFEGLYKLKNKVPRAIWDQVTEKVEQIWNKTTSHERMLAVTRVMEIMTDCVRNQNPPYWNDFMAIFSVADKVVELLNKRMTNIIESNSVELSHLTHESPTLSSLIQRIAFLLPDIMNTLADLFTKDLHKVLLNFKDVDRLKKIPCEGASVTDIIPLKKGDDFRALETFLCESTQQLLQELLLTPEISSAANYIDRATKGKTVSMDWVKAANHLELLREQSEKLNNFTGSRFSDIPTFDQEFSQASNRLKDIVANISSSERAAARFAGYLVDSALMTFGQFEDEENFTFPLQCDFKVNKDENDKPKYAKCLISGFKYSVWAATEVLKHVNSYLSWITGSRTNKTNEVPLINDLVVFVEEGFSLLETLMEASLSMTDENINMTDFCSGSDFLNKLVFPNPKSKEQISKLQEAVCSLKNGGAISLNGSFFQNLSISRLLKHLNNTWHRLTPTQVSSELSILIDEAFDFYSDVAAIHKDKDAYLEKLQNTITKLSAWEKLNSRLSNVFARFQFKSFTYSLQVLTPILIDAVKDNPGLAEKFGTAAVVLEVLNIYQKNESNSSRMENWSENRKELLEVAKPLMQWIEKYGTDFSGHAMYTVLVNGNKFFRLLHEEKPIEKICSQDVSEYVDFLPVSNTSYLQSAKNEFCEIDWMSITVNAKNELQSLNLTPSAQIKKFSFSLGSVLDALLMDIFMNEHLQLEKWNKTMNLLKESIQAKNFSWDEPREWLTPAIEAAISAVPKDNPTLYIVDDTVNGLNCRLAMLRGDVSWEKIELAYGNKPYILSLLRILNNSLEIVNITLETLLEPDKLEAIQELLGTADSKEFCNVDDWDRYVNLGKSKRLEILKSLQHLVCNGNATTLVRELNPERRCIRQKRRQSFPGGMLNATGFARHVEELYSTLGDKFLEAYKMHRNSLNASKEIVKTESWRKLFEAFWDKLQRKTTPVGITQTLFSVYRVINRIYRNETETSPAKKSLNFIQNAILALNIVAQPDENSSYANSMELIKESFDSAVIARKSPTRGLLETSLQELKYNTLIEHFEKHLEELSHFCSKDVETWRKKPSQHVLRALQICCNSPPKKWMDVMQTEFPRRTQLENYRAVNNIFSNWVALNDTINYQIQSQLREEELNKLAAIAYSVARKLSNDTEDRATQPAVRWPDLKILANSTWQIIPDFLEVLDSQSCTIFARYDPNMLKISELFGRIFSRIPDSEFVACNLTQKSSTELYAWFSSTFEVKTVLQMVTGKWDLISVRSEEGECVTPYGTASRGGKVLQSLANELALEKNKEQLEKCLEKVNITAVWQNVKGYLILFNATIGLFNDINIKPASGKNSIEEALDSAVEFITKQLPVYLPLMAVLKDKTFETTLFVSDKNFVESLKNILVDISWVARKNFSYDIIQKEVCNDRDTKKLYRIFKLDNEKEKLNVLCQEDLLKILLQTLDKKKIISELPKLQNEEFSKGNWLEKLAQNFQNLISSIFKLLSVGMNLEKSLSGGTTPVFSIIKTNTVHDLLKSINTVLENAELAFGESVIVEDLRHIFFGLKGLRSLQQLKIFEVKYKIEDMFDNSSAIFKILKDDFHFSEVAARVLLNSFLDLGSILSRSDDALTVRDTFCDPVKLDDLLIIEYSYANVSEISSALCNMSANQLEKLAPHLLQELAFSKLTENAGKLAVDGLLSKASLTEADVKEVVGQLKDAPEILSNVHGLITNITDLLGAETDQELKKINTSDSGAQLLGSEQSVKLIGKIMCGKSLKFFQNQFRFVSSQVKKTKIKLDQKEIRKLPSQFCVRGYEQVMQLDGGPILWSYLKPFLKGKILYAPNNEATRSVIKQLNKTVEIMTRFIDTLHIWGEGIGGLESLKIHEDSIQVLQNYVHSGKMKPLVENLLGGDVGDITETMNVSNVMEHVKKISGLLNLMQLVGHITQCVETNRFVGYKTEEELENAAINLHQNQEFIAAIVFLNLETKNSWRHKRGINGLLPSHVDYKIRLDVDNVPTTKRIRNKFWEPDPHNDFFEDLRYLRGFVYLQELLDRAILFLQMGQEPVFSPSVHLQQFPYPCYQKDGFGQFFRMVIPVVVIVAWIFFIAFTIQDHVLQRELHLEEMLTVMGLKPVIGWLAWFILAYSILSINISAFIPILKMGGVFPQTDWSLLSVFLFVYGIANVMYCYFVSSLFRTAAIASLIGIFAFLASFLPFVVIITLEWHLTFFEKIASCLPMSSAFAYGYLYIVRYETQGIGLHWDNMWSSPIAGDAMCFGYVLVMLAVDSVLYFVGGWYIANVWPAGHQAMKQPWYFFLLPTYWGLMKPSNSYIYPEKTLNRRHSKFSENDKSVGVSLLNLHVVYNRNSSCERKAVGGLTLDLLEGEITTLLGKNGAGKTTTINVLIGQYPPSSGAIYVYGKSVPSEFEEARKLLGYCPQYNTLFKFLTVREHLIFYSKLKGLLKDMQEITKDVDDILYSMGLWNLQNEQVRNLSGGLQRRVCVALAFVGGSKLIILDEPTSSVDPVARRSIWDLIVKQKSGRTVLLTTHHMDEADILSDKVAILHKGKLLCQGSPMLLKNKHSCGYKLIVSRHGPDTDSDNDSGRMSTSSSETEPCDGKVLLEFVRKTIPEANLLEDQGSEVVVSIPLQETRDKPQVFAEFFRSLDSSLQNLGYGSYGLSSATLEEVFLTLCNPEDDVTPQGSPTLQQHLPPMKYKKDLALDRSIATNVSYDDTATDVINSNHHIYWIPSEFDLCGSKVLSGLRLKLQQLNALLTKRFHHTVHNWKTLLCSILMPCLFIALAMGFSLIRDPHVPEPSLKLIPQMYGSHSSSFIKLSEQSPKITPLYSPLAENACQNKSITSDSDARCENIVVERKDLSRSPCRTFCRCDRSTQQCLAKNVRSPPLLLDTDFGIVYNLSGYDVSNYILDTYCTSIEQRYGGWSFHDTPSGEAIKVWYENSGYHAMPAYTNVISNAILKANLKEAGMDPTQYGITTYNHPLHLRVEQLGRETLIQRIADVGIAFTFLMGFTFIPASFIFYVVRERTNEEKRLQQIVGVGPFLYWLSALIWDLLLLSVAVGISAIVIAIFQLPVYVAKLNMPAVLTLAFLFGWSMMSLVYLTEKLFKEGTIAFLVVYCISLFIGVNFMVVVVVFGLFPPNRGVVAAVDIAKKIALVFPPYNLLNSLIEIAKNFFIADIYSMFGQDIYVNPFSMDLLGTYFIIMAVEGLVFFLLNILVEKPFASKKCCSCNADADLESACAKGEDVDVAEERKRVFSVASQNDVLKLVNVTKIFRGMMGKRTAVDNLALSIPKGECFGLLGVNGAGKTTLFRILTGQIRPTSGEAYLNGKSISQILASSGQSLGYCPQADALDDLLTPVQHLAVYAKLRGIPANEISRVVEAAIVKFSLEMYAKQPVGTLSRGNKRKLCTAIAMLGDPEIILLDEPTSGMDPLTRRIVWHNIMQAIKANRSVVLTSHSMEECDILCSRLAIMVNGRFCCLGSPQYLKHRFGRGYTITVHVDNGKERLLTISKFMSSNFPSASLKAHHYNMLEFNVPSKNIPLSLIFDIVEKERQDLGILDFSVSQTTLDQVFVSFAQQQSEDADFDDNFTFDAEVEGVSAAHYENPTYEGALDEDPVITMPVDACRAQTSDANCTNSLSSSMPNSQSDILDDCNWDSTKL